MTMNIFDLTLLCFSFIEKKVLCEKSSFEREVCRLHDVDFGFQKSAQFSTIKFQKNIYQNLADKTLDMWESRRSWEMIAMLCSGIVIVYCLRVNMSVAAQRMRDDLNWSETEKGLVLSSFYWGYAIGQIPASQFAQYYGAKWLFGASVLIPSLLTLLVPAACRHSFKLALVIRALIGFAESASFPACYYFFPRWIPNNEKTIMIATFMSGIYLGSCIGFSVSGMIAADHFDFFGYHLGGWPAIFYFFGVVGIAWVPLWMYYAYEDPKDHPDITQNELDYLNKGKQSMDHSMEQYSKYSIATEEDSADNTQITIISSDSDITHKSHLELHHQLQYDNVDSKASSVLNSTSSTLTSTSPQRRISPSNSREHINIVVKNNNNTFFTHPASLSILTVQWVTSWTNFMLLSEIPSFLTDDLGFKLEAAGLVSIAPYIAQFISSILFGFIFEFCQRRFGWRTRVIRQIAGFISLFGSGSLLIACSFAPSQSSAVILLILALFCFGAAQCGVSCAYLDVSPNYSTVLHAVGSTLGAIAGMSAPMIVAYCTATWEGVWGWRIVFMLTAFQSFIALIAWILFQTSDIVPELNSPQMKIKRIN
eukprot:gene12105-25395_t